MKSFAVSPGFTGEAVGAALMGGCVLGVTVAFKTGVIGEVLGVSGSTRGLLMHPTFGKLGFILGLFFAGVIMNVAYGGFEELPPRDQTNEDRAIFLVRLFFGGLLVGVGTALGNGCTSGHGLTGLARLTLRSWVAVPSFMGSAIIAASAFGTAADLPMQALPEEDTPTIAETAIWSGALVLALLLLLAAGAVLRRFRPEAAASEVAKVAVECTSGLVFGMGLSLSTMVRPSKVAGFLDFGSGTWDPTLPFVMGGALCITFPFYQVLAHFDTAEPLFGGRFCMPPRKKPVDRSLVIGAILFGAGWGTCGMCPGPMWVFLGGKPSVDVAVTIIGMLCGMGAWIIYRKLKARRESRVAPADPTSFKTVLPAPEPQKIRMEAQADADVTIASEVTEVAAP